MAKFNDLPLKQQLGVLVVVALLITGGLYYGLFRPMTEANKISRQALQKKQAENAQLEPFVSKSQEMASTIAVLRGQLQTLNQIVPSEKEAPQFMKLLQAAAISSGVEVRRYTANAPATKEFFTEVPFNLELDGAYYSMLAFFDRVGKMERIVNISGLKMASLDKAHDAAVKGTYQYGPGESVVASCLATTYFSSDAPEKSAASPAKGTAAKTKK
jgi:type IV pilus assembly protein PilO